MNRPARPETVLVVTATERLSPTMIRVSFRSEDLGAFSSSVFTDRYVKLAFTREHSPQADGEVVRTYAWMYILGSRGIPNLLDMIGIENVRLLNTPGAVLLGIVYGYLPLMIMPIYVSLEKLDRRLLEASADLGAKPVSTFFSVTLPLSLPGVMTGVALVTILLLGEYLIPQLLGGGKVFFIGNALVDLFLQSRNWPFGSAIAVTLVAIVVVVLMVAMRIAWKISGTRQVDLV